MELFHPYERLSSVVFEGEKTDTDGIEADELTKTGRSVTKTDPKTDETGSSLRSEKDGTMVVVEATAREENAAVSKMQSELNQLQVSL